MAKKRILEIAEEFEYENAACEAGKNVSYIKKDEPEFSFSLFPNEKVKQFDYIKLSPEHREDTLYSDLRTCEMKLLPKDFSENDERVDLITEFTFLSSKIRTEDNRAKDIQNFIEKYGFFFNIKEDCSVGIKDVYLWSKRLQNFAFLYSEVMKWKAYNSCDFYKIFECVIYFLTAEKLLTELGNNGTRNSYVFYFFELMRTYVGEQSSLYDEVDDDYIEDDKDAEEIDIYEGSENHDSIMDRIKKVREIGKWNIPYTISIADNLIEKLRCKLNEDRELLEDKEKFEQLLGDLGEISFALNHPQSTDEDCSERCINKMNNFIYATYVHYREYPDKITQVAIEFLLELKSHNLDKTNKLCVETYLVSVIAHQPNLEITGEMGDAEKSIKDFMDKKIPSLNLANKLIALSELVIEALVNYQFKGLLYRYDYKENKFELSIDDMYTAMVLAICNLDKAWEYRECKNCGCAFLVKRTTTNKTNCDKCKK